MKLRNKKSGEIGIPRIAYQEIYIDTENHITHCYKSLYSVFEEWEDYEEPKGMQWVDVLVANDGRVVIQYSNEEEAEKAVEKLKAVKRLKDNGLVIKKWNHTPDMHLTTGSFLKIEGFIPTIIENIKDLDFLFGGEE